MRDGLSVRAQPLTGAEPAGWWANWRTENPFLSWSWLSAMVDTPGAVPGLEMIVAERGGRPVGWLPVQRDTGPGRLHAVRAPGHDWLAPDHLEVIAEPGAEEEVAIAVVRYLAGDPSAEFVDFEGVACGGALARALERLRPPRFVRAGAEPVLAPFVDLRAPGPDPIHRPTLRQQVGRGLRRAERSGGGLDVVTEAGEVVDALDRLMVLHNERFGDRSVVFATETRRQFHRLAARRLAECGRARIYRLTDGATDCALLYALLAGSALYYYAMGFDPDAGLSPGRTVLGLAIQSAHREGFAEFDLLRGDHHFKQRFATGSREDAHVRAVRLSARSGTELSRLLPGWVGRRLRSRPAEPVG